MVYCEGEVTEKEEVKSELSTTSQNPEGYEVLEAQLLEIRRLKLKDNNK